MKTKSFYPDILFYNFQKGSKFTEISTSLERFFFFSCAFWIEPTWGKFCLTELHQFWLHFRAALFWFSANHITWQLLQQYTCCLNQHSFWINLPFPLFLIPRCTNVMALLLLSWLSNKGFQHNLGRSYPEICCILEL